MKKRENEEMHRDCLRIQISSKCMIKQFIFTSLLHWRRQFYLDVYLMTGICHF